MAKSLFPTVEIPSLSIPKQDNDMRYKRSLGWDLKSGDFIRDGSGKIVEDNGRDAYMVWCIKTSTTERYACEAYPHSIGTELESARQESTEDAVELAAERTIREALMVNPRTESVSDFEFTWDGDALHISFVVKGYDLEEFQIEI